MADSQGDSLNAPFTLPSPNAVPEAPLMAQTNAWQMYELQGSQLAHPPSPMELAEGAALLAHNSGLGCAAINAADHPVGFVGSPTPRTPAMHISGTTQQLFFDRGSSSFKGAPSPGQMGYMNADTSPAMLGAGHFDLLSDVYSMFRTTSADFGQPVDLGLADDGSPQPYTTEGILQSPIAGFEPNMASGSVPRQTFSNPIGQQAPPQIGLQDQIIMLQTTAYQLQNTAQVLIMGIEKSNETAALLKSSMEMLVAENHKMIEAKATNDKSDNKKNKTTACPLDKAPHHSWLWGDGVKPKCGLRATSSQSKFDRTKTIVRGFGLWLGSKASSNELIDSWIKFEDEPRMSVDGLYLRDFVKNKVEMTETMGRAVVRVIRMEEAQRRVGPDGHCHYVMHDWAKLLLEKSVDSEEVFLLPKFHYDLALCGKVVAMLLVEEQWASISVNLFKGTTMLIHPGQSDRPCSELLEANRPMMHQLTMNILAHMAKLANTKINDIPWDFHIALKSEHHMHGRDTGISTAYYSIPKPNQFNIQDPHIISLAKLTLVHLAVRACIPVTKKYIERAKKPRVTRKRQRDENGKFAPDSPSFIYYSDDASVAESNAI